MSPLARRLSWFVLLYACGVVVVGVVAYALRYMIR